MRELAAASRGPGNIYFTGGATALLLGFRDQTVDIDIKMDPEPPGAFEAIANLKNQLDVNVELAAPDDFIPAPPDWRERSRHIASMGDLQFFHYDFALQTLAKLERGHAQDIADAERFVTSGLVSGAELKTIFSRIEKGLLRYPAIDGLQFRKKVDDFIARMSQA
jgi:hypothetical protein